MRRGDGPSRAAGAAGACLLVLAAAPPAWAIRPFITDDARVVGRHTLQLETWLRVDREALQYWALPAFGPIAPLEVTLGGVTGIDYQSGVELAAAGPVFQVKGLLHDAQPNGWPGLAVAAGAFPPVGLGEFEANGWSAFFYVASTASLFDDERLLVHGNVGVVNTFTSAGRTNPIWGVGTQVRTHAGLYALGEVFSGDPYGQDTGGAFQVGLRYVFGDHVQTDATIGAGLWGEPRLPVWATAGLRLVSSPLW